MQNKNEGGPAASLQLSAPPQAGFASLPARPDFAARADSIGLGGPRTADAMENTSAAAQALGGSNRDVVANRRAIRMANMSAAEMLKAELGGAQPVKTPSPAKFDPPPTPVFAQPGAEDDLDVPGFGNASAMDEAPVASPDAPMPDEDDSEPDVSAPLLQGDIDMDTAVHGSEDSHRVPKKRKIDETEDSEGIATPDDEAEKSQFALKVNPDGTVEQEDTVRCVGSTFLSTFSKISQVVRTRVS